MRCIEDCECAEILKSFASVHPFVVSEACISLVAEKLFATNIIVIDACAIQGLAYCLDHRGRPGDVIDRRQQIVR